MQGGRLIFEVQCSAISCLLSKSFATEKGNRRLKGAWDKQFFSA
jgi:hypothetical protein